MSSVTAANQLMGGHGLDVRFAPLLAVTVVLNRIGPTTLCAIHPETGGLRGFWLDQSALSDAAAWVEQHNLAGRNTYFALNLPRWGLTKKPSKTEMVDLRALAADVDAKNGRSLDDALVAISRVGAEPNLIIATGGGFQPVWKLPEPLVATTENVRQVEAIGKRIVQLTGSDAVQSVDRIFRLPFTYNFQMKSREKLAVLSAALVFYCLRAEVLMDGEVLESAVWSNHEYHLHENKDALDRAEAADAYAASGASIDGQRTVNGSVRSNVVPLRGVASAVANTTRSKSMLTNAKSGLEQWHWVECLTADELDQMVQEIAGDAAMKPLADSDRSTWLRLLFGFVAFEATGAVGACEAAREWSKTSPRYLSDADFDRDWQSFDPERSDGITVGTLIHHASAVGINLEPWRERAIARRNQLHDEPDGAELEIPRGSPLSQLPEVINESLALAYLNASFFKAVRWGSAPSFGRFDADGSVHRLKPQDLQVALAGNLIEIPQLNGASKRVPAAKW